MSKIITPMQRALHKRYFIWLDADRKLEAIANRDEWFEKYSVMKISNLIEYFDKIAAGAPIIINIQHSYYYLDKLGSLCLSDGEIFDNWARCIRLAEDDGNEYYIRWTSKSKYEGIQKGKQNVI